MRSWSERRESGRRRQHRSAKGRTGNKTVQGLSEGLAKPFKVRKVEGSVLDNRTANASAELVQAKGQLGRRGEWPRVEDVVANELEDRSMKIVRPGLGYDFNLAPICSTALRRVLCTVCAELGYRLGRDLQPHASPLVLVQNAGGIDTVDAEVVIVLSMAFETNAAPIARTRIDGARHHGTQAIEVPAVEGKVMTLRSFDHRSDDGRVHVQHRLGRDDFNLRCRPRLA